MSFHSPQIGPGLDGLQSFLADLADGLIVEHWDVIEGITPEDTWVNSGKF